MSARILATVSLTLACLSLGGEAPAQDLMKALQRVFQKPEAPRPPAQPPPAPIVMQRAVMAPNVWSDEQFERWVFQRDQSLAGARQRLSALVGLHIGEIDRVCQLTEEQKTKLRLIGRGDIKRCLDTFEVVKLRFKELNNDINRLRDVQKDLNPLRMALQTGLMEGDSLFAKAVGNVLTTEQFARYEAVIQERQAFRHRATVALAVSVLEQSVSLRDEQRRALIALLTSETKPVRKSGQYDYYLVLDRLSRLPEEKLKVLVSELQWKIMSRQLTQYQATVRNLRQNGALVEEDGEVDNPEPQARDRQ